MMYVPLRFNHVLKFELNLRIDRAHVSIKPVEERDTSGNGHAFYIFICDLLVA